MRCYVKEKVKNAIWFQGSLFFQTESDIKLVTNFEEKYEYITLASFDVAKYIGYVNYSNVEINLKGNNFVMEPLPRPNVRGPTEFVDVVEDVCCQKYIYIKHIFLIFPSSYRA